MNGQQPRPQSPATGQNAGSPGTKRMRLENGEYQQVGNGRGAPQGVPPGNSAPASQAHQMLLAGGINPSQLTPQQFAAFQSQNPMTQHKSIQLYAQNLAAHTGRAVSALKQQGGPASGGMPNMPQNQQNHGSPMMPQTTEGATLAVSDFYATTPGGGGAMRAGMNPGTGSHALQDYQMQLMMLEQQNKKRLMMARAEQDNIAHHGDSQRRMEAGFPQSMSPGSRAAPSPQPQGGPKMVGTPKMQNQVGPGSPLPEGQISGQVPQRNSPAAMGAFNSQMPQEAHQNMLYPMKDSMGMMGNTQGGGAPNGAMMRPPGSHPGFNGQMPQGDMPRMGAQQAGRGGPSQMVNPGWQAQQQQQQQQMQMHQAQQQQQQQQQQQPQQQPGGQQSGQPPQVGTPQQARQNLPHQAMPPPSAPAGAPSNGRTPSSPQVQNQQPATPTQSHKAAPKAKGTRDAGKKVSCYMLQHFSIRANSKQQRPTKKNAGAAAQAPNPVTPSSEPPTPTTPQHPSSFGQGAAHPRPPGFAGAPQGGNGTGQPPQQNTPNPAPAAPPAPITAQDPTTANAFSDMPADLNLPFDAFPDNPGDSLLDNFDFDSFLNTEDNPGMAGFDGLSGQWSDAVEAGTGES